jgi:hypothetical protein
MGGKRTLAPVRDLASISLVRAIRLCLLIGCVVSQPSAHAAAQAAAVPVCQVIRNNTKLIGKRVTVEGYIFDLSSHGFALIGKRRECLGALFLLTEQVDSGAIWRKAFANSLGPKRAVLVGTVGWQQPHFGGSGHVPALRVERVQFLSPHEAALKNF